MGIGRADLVDAQWADNGPGWVALLLASADAVLAVQPGYVDAHVGLVGLHPDGSPEVRALFPKDGAMVEDPVTGSLNAGLAQWLIGAGRLPSSYVAGQGHALHRDGRVHVDAVGDDVWVGGDVVTVVSGDVHL
jgi:predicted PhzF superfamily epimerase YddE/YHI9